MRTFEAAEGRGPCSGPKFKLTHYPAGPGASTKFKLSRYTFEVCRPSRSGHSGQNKKSADFLKSLPRTRTTQQTATDTDRLDRLFYALIDNASDFLNMAYPMTHENTTDR